MCQSGEEGLAPYSKLSRMVELQKLSPSQGGDVLVAVGAWMRCSLSKDRQAHFPMFSWQGPGSTDRSSPPAKIVLPMMEGDAVTNLEKLLVGSV